MNANNPSMRAAANSLCWIARLTALAMLGLFVAFAVGQGFPPLWKQPISVQLIFAGWALLFTGYVVGWRQQAMGGALVVLALVAMNLVEFAVNGKLLCPAFLMWLVPGALYLLAAWADRCGRSPAL